MKKLPDSELEIMLAIWNNDNPVSCYELKELLYDKTHWAVTTISTMLTRLENKGFVSSEKKGKTKYFSPLITKDEYVQIFSRNFIDKLFGHSLQNFIACLASSKDFSQKEIDELRNFLDEQKHEN